LREDEAMHRLPRELADHPPVFVAPMAGGPSRPALVEAAWRGGFLAQLAGGHTTPAGLAGQVDEVRAAGVQSFGVNLFVPAPADERRVDRAAYAVYRNALLPEAERYAAELPGEPVEDDDAWADKVALLCSDPVPFVSFTFGLPDRTDIAALRRAGSLTIQTVTSLDEARAAAEAGVDALIVQGYTAGGHSGTWDARRSPQPIALDAVLAEIAAAVDLPLIGAGGVGDPGRVRELLNAGACAVSVGTVVLRSPESGASALYKAALADPGYDGTQLTRAFTGRLARALRNRFVIDHTAQAPVGYPAVHHLTRPLRSAAAAAGDTSTVNLWAGVGHRTASDAPAARSLTALLP
jgi:NAD(P)H-dependent flavin oxidoreductase YrpB (nitropropane dioxygenase family)